MNFRDGFMFLACASAVLAAIFSTTASVSYRLKDMCTRLAIAFVVVFLITGYLAAIGLGN